MSPSRSNGWAKMHCTRPGDHLRLGHARGRRQEHGELVATEPRHGVRLAHGLLEALGDLDEERVTARVPEGVVDLLEAVDVEQDEADRVAGARRDRRPPARAAR